MYFANIYFKRWVELLQRNILILSAPQDKSCPVFVLPQNDVWCHISVRLR